MKKTVIKPELRTILDRYGINPDDEDWCWDVHGTIVLTHRAYEIIAAKEKIQFGQPAVVNAIVRDGQFSIALIVTAQLGERTEWSFGEASDLNYRGSAKMSLYPYAMAEKRGKDRVIAKLVGLAAYCYSEDEADDFAKPGAKARKEIAETVKEANGADEPLDEIGKWQAKVHAALANAKKPEDVDALLERCKKGLEQADKDNKTVAQDIRARFTARKIVLEARGAA